MRVFDAIQGEQKALCRACIWCGFEEVFEGEGFAFAEEGDGAAVVFAAAHALKLFAAGVADADFGGTAEVEQGCYARIGWAGEYCDVVQVGWADACGL